MTSATDPMATPPQGDYFCDAHHLPLTAEQQQVVRHLRQCIAELKPEYLGPKDTSVEVTDGDLTLEMAHSTQPSVEVTVVVDSRGQLDVACASLHPTFGLRFNDPDEPEDSIGDLGYGLEVVCALIAGRVVAEITWRGETIVASRDLLTTPDGENVTLYRQYHGLLGLASVVFGGRREVRRVGFVRHVG